jgi:GNAT superfamily N-acetyltransferase
VSRPDSLLRVRPAGTADVECLTRFNVRLAEESEGLALDPALVRRGVAAILAHPDRGFYLVAEAQGSVVGQLQITFEWSDWRNAFFWWLQSVYVAPEWRRRGALRALSRAVIEAARSAGDVCGLRLYAHHANAPAHEVYRRLGLRPLDYVMFGAYLDGSDEGGRG